MSTITIAILIFVVTLILYGVNKFSMGTVGMITMAALRPRMLWAILPTKT